MDGKRSIAKWPRNLVAGVVLAAVSVMTPVAGLIAQDDLQFPDPYSPEYFERLEYYESKYSDEVFGFCERRFLMKIRKLSQCLRNQQQSKDEILANAQYRLGSQSHADALYNQCLDYHPGYGVARVGGCVEIRLMLHERVGDDSVERVIYQKCAKKWRGNNASAIDVCCAQEGRYYMESGQLQD